MGWVAGVLVEVTRTVLYDDPGTVHPVGVQVFGNSVSTVGFRLLGMIAER